MKNFRQKAIPAVAMLAVASLSLASVTYAWFTSNKEVSASNINVNVAQEAGGIAISNALDGTYGTSVKIDNKYVGEEDGATQAELKPCSTTGELTNSKAGERALSFYEGTMDKDDNSKITCSGNTVDYALKVDLYFENTNSLPQEVYFNYSDETYDTILKSLFGDGYGNSSMAIRFAFINQGYVESKTASNWSGDATCVVIEPNWKNHLSSLGHAAGKEYYYGIAGKIESATSINPGAAIDGQLTKVTTYSLEDCNLTNVETVSPYEYYDADDVAASYDAADETRPVVQVEEKYYLKSDLDKDAEENITPKAGANEIKLGKTIKNTLKNKLFTVQPGYNWIQVVIWLEGQDCDCVTAISGLDLVCKFNFGARTAE